MTNIRYVVNMNIKDQEKFEVVAQKAIDANKDLEGKVSYDWYVNGDDGIIMEEWANDKAFFAHLGTVGPLMPELLEACDLTVHVISQVSDDARKALEGLPSTFYEPLSASVTV